MPMPRSTTTAAAPTPQTPRISGRRVATVEEDGLAGHEVRARGGEEDDERTDLLQPTRAPHRNVPRQPLVDPRIAARLLGHVAHEPPRRAPVVLHLAARPLDPHITRDVGGRDDRAASRALDQPRRLLEVGLRAPRQRDARARPRQRMGHRAAKPTAGAGDDGNLSREVRQRYSSSIVFMYLVDTTFRFTFSVGVSSPPSWLKSTGSTMNFLILAYDCSCEFFSSTVRPMRSRTLGCLTTTAGSVVRRPLSRANFASSSGLTVMRATGYGLRSP